MITKNNGVKSKSLIILVVIIVLLITVSASGYYILNRLYSELTDEKQSLENELKVAMDQVNDSNVELNQIETELEQHKSNLDENISKLQELKSGNEYYLHNPTLNEAWEFLENNEETDIQKIIDDAKNRGLRCGYVEVAMEIGVFELLVFDTLDYDMVYLECDTYYLVYPVVGLNYFDCIYEQPYGPSHPEDNDMITEILVMW